MVYYLKTTKLLDFALIGVCSVIGSNMVSSFFFLLLDIICQWLCKKMCLMKGVKPRLGSNEFVCVEVLRPSQPNGVISSVVSLPNHTFTGQA